MTRKVFFFHCTDLKYSIANLVYIPIWKIQILIYEFKFHEMLFHETIPCRIITLLYFALIFIFSTHRDLKVVKMSVKISQGIQT